MNISISMVEILIVITAYTLGVWTGSLFLCAGTPRGSVPQDQQDADTRKKVPQNKQIEDAHGAVPQAQQYADARRTYSDEYSGELLTDAEKRKRYEEDLKAFQDCMKYSQETAYGVRK